MSDLAIFARQGDLTRSSSMTQKRPLSIITENDSDDPDVTDCSKHRHCVDSSGKESKSRCSENTSSSNQASNDRNAISAHVDLDEPLVYSSVVEHDGRSEASLVTVKSILAGTQPSGHTAKSKRSTSLTSRSETNNSMLELKSSYRSDINENKILDEPFSKSKSDNAKLARSKAPETDISKHQLYSQPIMSNNNPVQALCEMTQTNNLGRSKPNGDGPSLARTRGKADRHNLLSILSPTFPSSSPSSAMLKFGSRSWTHPSPPRTFQQPTNSTGHTYPQISVTTNEGTTLVGSLSLSSSPDSDDCCDNSATSTTKWLLDISDHNNASQPHLNRVGISSNSTPNSSKLSSCFSRRMSNESAGSESDLSDGDIGSDESSMNYLSYFRRLKETTDRLRLSTRRPSIMLWRQQFMECQTSSVRKSSQSGDASDDRLTLDRKQRIDLALEWLRNQLQEMRSQDQNLAKQLLAIRHDIHKLKLQRSTEEHQELIDDFQFELQELQEFSDVLDLPLPEYAANPLKHIGVTRLNISARRFSAC